MLAHISKSKICSVAVASVTNLMELKCLAVRWGWNYCGQGTSKHPKNLALHATGTWISVTVASMIKRSRASQLAIAKGYSNHSKCLAHKNSNCYSYHYLRPSKRHAAAHRGADLAWHLKYCALGWLEYSQLCSLTELLFHFNLIESQDAAFSQGFYSY